MSATIAWILLGLFAPVIGGGIGYTIGRWQIRAEHRRQLEAQVRANETPVTDVTWLVALERRRARGFKRWAA